MTYAPPDENTLGVIFASKSHNSPIATITRSTGNDDPQLFSLGTAFIGAGTAVVVSLYAAFGLFLFAIRWEQYPNPFLAAAAWTVLIVVIAATIAASRSTSGQLSHWMFALVLGGLAAVIALDLYAIWPLHDIGEYATAAIAAGMTLLLVLTVRPSSNIVIALSAIGITLAVAIVINVPLTPSNLAQQITALAFTVVPTIILLALVINFRRLIQVELDRVLVQSTLSAPRLAVGMMASEELARLDLAAENLLESVASESTTLPLTPKIASAAASLATELRLHLIEGRRETWLYHAIAESKMLGRSVSLTDKGSLAGLLDPVQRDGLLSTVWLLVTDTARRGTKASVHITITPSTTLLAPSSDNKVPIEIEITSIGVSRNRIDASTWESIAKIGRYTDSTEDSSVRLDIECLVDNPASQ